MHPGVGAGKSWPGGEAKLGVAGSRILVERRLMPERSKGLVSLLRPRWSCVCWGDVVLGRWTCARMDLLSPKAVERAFRRHGRSFKPPAEYDDGGNRLYDCGNRIKVIETKKNTVLARPGDPPCLFFVMSGTIRTSLHGRHLYEIKPGGMLGLIYIQTGEFWSVGVESYGQTIVLQMSRSNAEHAVRAHGLNHCIPCKTMWPSGHEILAKSLRRP